VTDFTITGRLASFGRGGMIKDISNRLLRDFATCLQQRLAAEPAGGRTTDEAAASAGAGDAIGKSPAEVSGEAAAETSGKSPAEVSGAGPAQADNGEPSQAAPVPTQTGPSQPPAAAPRVKGISLLLSVLWERIRRLFGRR
jgi:uncharacterized protein